MVKISSSDEQLTIGDINVNLPEPIEEAIEADNSIIVLMDTLAKSNYSRNVWAFDFDGQHRWKIQETDKYDGEIHPYTNISFREGTLGPTTGMDTRTLSPSTPER